MFQDFQLSITHLGENRYFLRTEKVAAGVPLAEEQVDWDVEHWLATAQNLMSDPLSRLLQGTGRLSAQHRLVTPDTDLASLSMTELPSVATTLREFGQQLHGALFVGSLRDSWSKAQAIAHNQNQILRLRLGLKEARLLSLPWEVMNRIDLENGDVESLTTGIDTSFTRYHSKTQGSADNPSMDDVAEQTLKILMVLASPADQERLELWQEAEHLQTELEKDAVPDTPPLELTILENPGRQELTETLEQGQYQVFHYAGHSNLGHFGGDIYLVNRATGLTEALAGSDLAGLLTNNGVQLALFNSCHGADGISNYQAEETTEKSLAQALVRRGIPAVLAMSAQIPDQVALTFTRLLYRNLHQGYPIDFSLGRVRQGLISAYGSHQLYWALPVLYMNPHFHGLLHHRPLNREGLAELLHIADFELATLSPEDEARLAIADCPDARQFDDSDFLADETDESLFSPPSSPHQSGGETAFIKDILTEISADLQDLKDDRQERQTQPTIAAPTFREQATQLLKKYPWQLALGLGLAIALITGGTWQLFRQHRLAVPIINTELPSSGNVELNKFDNQTLLALARQQQDDWSLLARITAHLLDQQALPQAKAVLYDIVDPEAVDTAQYNFLRGRYAWQLILKAPTTVDNTESFDDVRRYWTTAYKGDPQPYYLHAAGFADYAAGDYDAAGKIWTETINLTTDNPQLLSEAYAGLALTLYQKAQTQSGEIKENWQGKALKLRDSAYSTDADAVTIDTLSQNWLWPEGAIATWQQLRDLN